MTAIRIERKPLPATGASNAAAATPPEWKWDTLPVLKEVIVVDAPPTDEPPTVEAGE